MSQPAHRDRSSWTDQQRDILRAVERLEAANRRLQEDAADGSLERLIDLLVHVHRLGQAQARHEREEEGLLAAAGAEVGRVLRAEHADLANRREWLRRLATEEEPMGRDERRRRIDRAVRRLAEGVRAHLEREESLLAAPRAIA